ncbi:hypothetical protein AI3008V1_5394 (plasmid) [Klebsiella pneumoniae]|nr:hypothetical protein AI3008V1_5394 [Klebsiella pneumoniae]
MRVFFEGKFNSDLYDYEKDKPHGVKQGQTSFAVRFTFSESEINDVSEDLSQDNDDDDDDDDDDSVIDLGVLGEQEELGDSISLDDGGTKQQETKPTQSRGRKLSLRDRYLQLFNMIDDSRLNSPQNEVTVHLTISNKNNYFYTVFKGYKRKPEVTSSMYTSVERRFIEKILSSFECVYIPSSKSIDDIYHNLLVPYVRSEVASAMKTSVQVIHDKLLEVSKKITNEMTLSGIDDCSFMIKAPPSLDELFGRFEVSIKDTIENVISSKGMGLQCLSLFSSFKSISERKLSLGKKTIWMVEEPESFLHPSLGRSCNHIFNSLMDVAYVLITTHSLSFVSDEPSKIIELYKDEAGVTKDKKHEKRFNAVASIRENLGVRFSDFFNISSSAVFVEGITDKQYIESILKLTYESDEFKNRWPFLRSAKVDEFGGVSQLGGFLKGCYEFISKEVPVISIFDGDEAGVKERTRLQSYFGKKQVRFESNKDYISVRSGFAIEGLFPDDFISDAMETHPSWFIGGKSVDADDVIEPFKVQDNKKTNLSNFFLEKCRVQPICDWISRWEKVFNVIDSALRDKSESITDKKRTEDTSDNQAA